MVTNRDCPEASSLAEYAASDTTDATGRSLDRHLAECRKCLHRFLELGRKSAAPDVPECHVVREVGRGRFGVVYKAWWTRGTPRLVALKVLTSPSEMERSRFEREIGVLKKLDSPWIVKCHESGTTGENLYYVMDFVEGVHLDHYLEHPPLHLDGKLRVFQRVCRAVADAHDRGVVHRDLKPRNILIDDDGNPHVLDFGICSINKEDWGTSTQATITHPGDVIGTLRYMSPEQAWGGSAGPIDERSDIWALGIMLHEIVTSGGYPYSLEPMPEKPIHEALLERIRKELPRLPNLSALPRGRDLEVLLERCLAWDADQRMRSSAILADDLERYLNGRRIITNPPGIGYRARRLLVGAAVRSRGALAICFAATTMVLLTATFYLGRVGWLVTGRDYQDHSRRGGAWSPAGDVRDDFTIVAVGDQSIEPVTAYAREHSIVDVTEDLRTWRAVHGRLMERLVSFPPRVLVWDYYFTSPRPADVHFVNGLQRLHSAGTPVVLATFDFDQEGRPKLSPGITEPLGDGLRFGIITARDMVARPGEFPLALRRDQATVPSLALSTLAAVLHSNAQLDLEWPARDRPLQLIYRLSPGAYLRERDQVALTTAFSLQRDDEPAQKGDLLACTRMKLSHPSTWENRTVPYERILNGIDDELKEWVGGKVVIVGDLRRVPTGSVPDRHPVRFGATVIEEVPGVYLIADAVAGLLERRYMVAAFPPPTATFALMLLAAVMGCWLPTRPSVRATLSRTLGDDHALPLLALAAIGMGAMVGTHQAVSVHAGMATAACLLPAVGSFWVERARHRHFVVERREVLPNSFPLAAEGTLTLPSKQRT